MNELHETGRPFAKDEFLEKLKMDNEFSKKYGNKGVDQIKNIIESLKTNPYSRYHILNAWAAFDFKEMALPPCHLLYQFIVRPLTLEERIDYWFHVKKPNRDVVDHFDEQTTEEKLSYFKGYIPEFYLDLNMYQRSCDTTLGVPYNLASMSALLMIIAKVSNMIPGKAYWTGGDTHIYIPHIEKAKEQTLRTPYSLPTLEITKDIQSLEDILALNVDDFKLNNYENHPRIEFELFAGNKK